MTSINRRTFVKNISYLPILFSCKQYFGSLRVNRTGTPRLNDGEDPNDNEEEKLSKNIKLIQDPNGLIDLPPNFSYTILQSTNDILSDGYLTPPYPDGMGLFTHPITGDFILMKNHLSGNINKIPKEYLPNPQESDLENSSGSGGVVRLLLDKNTLEIKQSNLVLAGTKMNSTGGITPWGWLSGEKSMSKGHGYTYLVSHLNSEMKRPIPLKSLGRFNHDGFYTHPASYKSYLTQDRQDGLFYQFTPDNYMNPFSGKLQALKIKNQTNKNMDEASTIGEKWPGEWVDIDEVDPVNDTIHLEGMNKGAAIFSKGNSITSFGDTIYFSCTYGGSKGLGQIYSLTPNTSNSSQNTCILELVQTYNSKNLLQRPDDIYIDSSQNVYFTQDIASSSCIYIIPKNLGKSICFATNVRNNYKFSGLCMDRNEKYLFVNMHQEGITLVIKGPFEELRNVLSK